MRYDLQRGFTSFVAPSRMRKIRKEAKAEQAIVPKDPILRVVSLSKVRKPNRHKRQDNEALEIFRRKVAESKARKRAA